MTLKELSQLYYLNREIEMDKRRLQELEVKALPGSQVLTGMPHTPGVKDKVGEYAAEIADLRGIIEAKHQQCLYERSRLERYISSIDDSLLRQIFTYRFINGLPWRQVAACIGGGIPRTDAEKLCNGIWNGTKASCPFCPLHSVLQCNCGCMPHHGITSFEGGGRVTELKTRPLPPFTYDFFGLLSPVRGGRPFTMFWGGECGKAE